MVESISVVVTCHNLEKYIGAALRSVFEQDYDGAVEVVVVDDCSSDGSAMVIKAFPDAIYLRTPENSGVLMATVLGMERASGDLIFFLDGDDVWGTGKLTAVTRRFREDAKLALVTHDLSYIDADGRELGRPSRVAAAMNGIGKDRASEKIRDGILLHGDHVWLGSAYAIRRAMVGLVEFCAFARRLPDPFNTYQDWPLAFWAAAQENATLGYVDQKLFLYRLHGCNHSGDASSVGKAVRNNQRAVNTTAAMLDIANMFNLPAKVKRLTKAKLAYGSYLVDLYRGHRSRAAANFLRGFSFMRRDVKLTAKECIRFAGIQIVGAERFTSATARVKRASSSATAGNEG